MANAAQLIAPGMNCGLCAAHLRPKNPCPGCRIPDTKKPITRLRCQIKTCQFFQNTPAKFCYDCPDFPCANLKHLDHRYQSKYHMSMLENLNTIKQLGLKKFLVNQKAQWTCKHCGGVICVHTATCSSCGLPYLPFPYNTSTTQLLCPPKKSLITIRSLLSALFASFLAFLA